MYECRVTWMQSGEKSWSPLLGSKIGCSDSARSQSIGWYRDSHHMLILHAFFAVAMPRVLQAKAEPSKLDPGTLVRSFSASVNHHQ